MSDWQAEHRAIIELGAGADEPSSDQRERVRRRVAFRVGAGAGLAVVAAASMPKIAAGANAMGIVGKLVVAASLVAGAGAVTLYVAQGHKSPVATMGEAPSSVSAPRAVGPVDLTSLARSHTPELGGSLEAEVRLVQDGDAALRANDPLRAVALFDQHAKQFPRGVLAEERSGERVLALCALGRAEEARVDAADFLRTYGVSPISARVRASCGGRGGTSP